MAFEVKYSPLAEIDLDRVWDEVYEVSRDFDVADKYIRDIRSAIRQKNRYPQTGIPLNYMGEFTGMYYVSFKEYMAFYVIQDESIKVSRVLYSRSDYMKTLFGKSEYKLEDTEP